MKRWYARVAEEKVIDDRSADDFRAFFNECLNLRDWLKRDPMISDRVRAAAESLVNSSFPLGLCADTANSAKHFRLDRRYRIDPTTRMEQAPPRTTPGATPRGAGAARIAGVFIASSPDCQSRSVGAPPLARLLCPG